MKTIFDFEPTPEEIQGIAYNYLDMRLRCGEWNEKPTKEWYLKNIKPDWAIFDIAVLLHGRSKGEDAQAYWAQIPGIAEEYQRGNDYEIIPS